MQLTINVVRICLMLVLLSGILFTTQPLSAKLLMMPGPSFQSATFFGGAGNQRGTAIGVNSSGIYLAGYTEVGGAHGLLVKYATPPGSPVWNAQLNNTLFLSLGLSASHAYPVGGAEPPVCGASDGVGDTERKSLLARYDTAGSFQVCGSTNFFPYRGHEYYNAAVAVVESGSPFVYTGGWAEQTGFSRSFPFVLTKHDAAGAIVNQVTEPGITLGTFGGCCPGDSSIWGLAEMGGAIYTAGHSRLPGLGEDNVRRPVLMKYDAGLNRLWKARPTDNPGGFFGAVTGFNGALYAAGQAGDGSSADYLIEKYDTAGNRLWMATSGGGAEDVLTGIVGVGNQLFAVGYTRSAGSGGADVALLEIDPMTGATLSTTYYGGTQDERANGVAANGTDLYIVGESNSFASAEGNVAGQSDMLLLHYSLNQVPVAMCQNVTVTAGASCTANASINNGSFDPDGDSITVTQSPAGPYPLGTTTVTLTVTNSKGASSQCTATVTVVDDTAPTLTLKPSLSLWPPNHKYTTVTTAQMAQSVSDNCTALNLSQVVIEQVTSDEPDNGLGDGDTANDIVIAPDCKSVQLRAECGGAGNGRVYSVRLRVQDGAGNGTRQEFKVTVPLNQNGSPAVEGAPVSLVTSACGGGSTQPTGSLAKPAVVGDFDGDGKTDLAVWRGQQSDWLVFASANDRLDVTPWGAQYAPYNDVLAPGDYDGDGKVDRAVYRRSDGKFYVKCSANGAVIIQALGTGKDEPVPADYDGDGKSDFAVWQAARALG